MSRLTLGSFIILTLLAGACAKLPERGVQTPRVVPAAPKTFQIRAGALKPPAVGMYHGAFPDFPAGSRDGLGSDILAMERLAGKKLAWVQYENDWAVSTEFPWTAVADIMGEGRVPYIRILPRSRSQQNLGADPVYTMENFLAGHFDEIIERWAQMAKAVGKPIIVEFGPEVNGSWYSWNGMWNGGKDTGNYGDPALADGPERFRDTYRHFIDIFRRVGAGNITWVFHVDSQPSPRESWNGMANYYPGDNYIDWIGVSTFGAQLPGDRWNSFTEVLDRTYNELVAISPLKPVAVVEFGVTEKPGEGNGKAAWLTETFDAFKKGMYPHIKAVSYWHERSWISDPLYSFRIDSSAQALESYRAGVAGDFFRSDAVFSDVSEGGSSR